MMGIGQTTNGQPIDNDIRPRMDTRFLLLLQLVFVSKVVCDDNDNESDGIHLSDLINQLQGKPYYTYHRVGNDRTYYYHSAGDNSNYGTGPVSSQQSSYQYYQNPQVPEGYRQVYVNGVWRWAYQYNCYGKFIDYVNGSPRYFCSCGRLGTSYQLGTCNGEYYWNRTGK